MAVPYSTAEARPDEYDPAFLAHGHEFKTGELPSDMYEPSELEEVLDDVLLEVLGSAQDSDTWADAVLNEVATNEELASGMPTARFAYDVRDDTTPRHRTAARTTVGSFTVARVEQTTIDYLRAANHPRFVDHRRPVVSPRLMKAPSVVSVVVDLEISSPVVNGLEEGLRTEIWQEQALCSQTDPDAFYLEQGGSNRAAKRICGGCDVRAECLDYALKHDESLGVWGGLSESERRRLQLGEPLVAESMYNDQDGE